MALSSSTGLAKRSPIQELEQAGFYGRVHAWGGVFNKAHGLEIDMPQNAPVIISDYHSTVGANGSKRGGRHRGLDIFEEIGSPVIAAANGHVLRSKVDKCWGPTILINHGKDKNGRVLYALYGHVRNITVKVGQKIKRGQKIAEIGEDIFTPCGAGFHHLHFQISYDPRKVPIVGWGWANFVRDGFHAPNPHDYWEDGKGKVTCFEEGRKYSPSGLTYPVPCRNEPSLDFLGETIFAGETSAEEVLNKDELPDDSILEEGVIAFLLDATEVLEAEAQLESDPRGVFEKAELTVGSDEYVVEESSEEASLYSVMEEKWAEEEYPINSDDIASSNEEEDFDHREQDFKSLGLRYLDLTTSKSAANFLD